MYRFYPECEPRRLGESSRESGAFRIKPVGLKRWVKQQRLSMGIVTRTDLSKHSSAGGHETTRRYLS